ncbi:MAG: glycosyltransferase family 2 protein [Candidatus Pacearchaeota archaeon]|nr:glycosyltransferase family 2 protein [Candidatus Pacearchaeota archaeon]
MAKKTEVCIITLNWNGIEMTKICLNLVKKYTSNIPYKMILVDNNSNDGSQKIIKKEYPWVDLLELKTNEGFSGGNNRGIEYACKKYDPDYYFFLSNDVKVTENWLRNILDCAEKFPEGGIFGPKQFNFNGDLSISSGWIKNTHVKYYDGNEDKEVNWVSGAGFLVKKEVIMKIGMLDEMYNPTYYEETEFERRANRSGFKIFHSPKSIIFHRGGWTTDKDSNTKYNLIFYRNRARFFSKYQPMGLIFRFFEDLIRTHGKIKLSKLLNSYITGLKNRNKTIIKNPYVENNKD